MRLIVLGGAGAWPSAAAGCGGYLVEEAGFRVLIDPGYAILPRLLEVMTADQVDAILISHQHPDHCADVNPLLRARALGESRPAALPIYALAGATRAVLALDRPGMLDGAYLLSEFEAGDRFVVGPFVIDSRSLPHFVPNAGLRLVADAASLTYTGDAGPSAALVELARESDLLLAEATFADMVPNASAGLLTSAREAGDQAARANVKRLVLTHLWPGTDPARSIEAASAAYRGNIDVARPGLIIDVS